MRNADISDPRSRVLPVLLTHQAEALGDEIFLLDDSGAEWSYAQADSMVDRYASSLAALGVGKGDTVAFFMENSAEQALCAFAVNRLGAMWSPVCTDYRGEWLEVNLGDIGASVLIVDAGLMPRLAPLNLPKYRHVVVLGEPAADLSPALTLHGLAAFRDAPARRIWTSGTTGRSKGVMQSHNAWIYWSGNHNEHFRKGIRAGERFYGCTPMYNSGGWIMNIFPALVSGTAACIDRRFSVRDYWSRIRHYRASHTMTLGTMHMYLAAQPPLATDKDNTLRTLHMTPVVPAILRPFMERFGIETVYSGYGQSEIMGATRWRSDLDLNPSSCGLVAAPGSPTEVRLLDDNDNDVPVGQTGEIAIRGREPFINFSGYFNNAEATVQAWRNLWHHTGDLGRLDENGELFFVDRKKDSTRHKGRNISSFEVEHTVRRFPGVSMVAAVGIRLPELHVEDELLLAIVPKPGEQVDPLALCKFIDANAPYFFVPRYVWITDALPMTPTMKVQKYLIRDAGLPQDAWDMQTQTDWRPTRNEI
jgi:carnitine-CoA ligase